MSSKINKSVRIRRGRIKNLLNGHPWIFSGAIEDSDQPQDGELVRVISGNRFLGIGYFHSKTDIAVRMLTHLDCQIDSGFFADRFRLLQSRKEPLLAQLPGKTNCYRLAFAEADGVPGLIVDKYDEVLVCQFHTQGMDQLKQKVTSALQKVFKPKCIVERSDLAIRAREGLASDLKQILFGELPEELVVYENGLKFLVNVWEGQKTGLFLDQRENRQALTKFSSRKNVLSLFSYTGGFSLYAAQNAKKVVSVDASGPALDFCRKNFALNGFNQNHEFVKADCFDFLKTVTQDEFNCIILDPPALAKNRKQAFQAKRAYLTLNSKALEKLPWEGLLISASCTSHLNLQELGELLHQAAIKTGCLLQYMEMRGHPWDHPQLSSFPEGHYLKFFAVRKCRPY